jgi:hypothetical protein
VVGKEFVGDEYLTDDLSTATERETRRGARVASSVAQMTAGS